MVYGAFNPKAFWLLDWVNLMVHEAGHLIFLPFGRTVSMMGGTIMQLLMPLLFVIHFFRKKEPYQASIMVLWVGENFFHISPYVKDARAMELPLLGGGVHDWAYLLRKVGWLDYDLLIGDIVWSIGFGIILLGFVIALRDIYKIRMTP